MTSILSLHADAESGGAPPSVPDCPVDREEPSLSVPVEEYEALLSERDRLRQESESLRSENDRLAKERLDLESDNRSLDGENSELRGELSQPGQGGELEARIRLR